VICPVKHPKVEVRVFYFFTSYLDFQETQKIGIGKIITLIWPVGSIPTLCIAIVLMA